MGEVIKAPAWKQVEFTLISVERSHIGMLDPMGRKLTLTFETILPPGIDILHARELLGERFIIQKIT